MQRGVHLPQAGMQASPDRILRHAMRAEALGLSDVWVSEHIVVPKDAPYPPTPVFYDPVTFEARTIAATIQDMRMLPRPSVPIPIWIGGTAERQIARAVKLQGWHGSRQSPAEIAPIVECLCRERPDPAFAISMRIRWDGVDTAELRSRLKAYGTLGVGHVLVEPNDREVDDQDRILEGVGRIAGG